MDNLRQLDFVSRAERAVDDVTLQRRDAAVHHFDLSATDLLIIRYLANGDEVKEIAASVHKSMATVKHRLELTRRAMRARSVRHLVALAFKYCIVLPSEID